MRNGHRAGDIIKSVRALTRKSTPAMISLGIDDVIREVIVLMGAEFRRRGVRVDTSLSSDLVSVVGDQVQLQQVVLNLIMNGIEAMAHPMNGQPRLQISSTKDKSGGEHVAIADSGPRTRSGARRPGSSKPSSPPSQRAWGSGLSICRSIIDAHGGQLWASPNLPNHGAVFQFTLPAAAGDASKA